MDFAKEQIVFFRAAYYNKCTGTWKYAVYLPETMGKGRLDQGRLDQGRLNQGFLITGGVYEYVAGRGYE